MLNFGTFLFFPQSLKDRQQSLKNISISSINIKKEVGLISISSITNKKYQTQIKIYDEEISSKSPCEVSCTCDSFKYEFSSVLDKHDALIDPKNFRTNKIAKVKNPLSVVSGCKHIISLANTIWSNRIWIKNSK